MNQSNLIELTGLWSENGKVSGSGLEMKTAAPENKWDVQLMVGPAIVGRLWKSEKPDKNGHHYYSGSFLQARCLIFRNEKKSEKAPDYRVLITEKSREPEQPTTAPETDNEDDLPF